MSKMVYELFLEWMTIIGLIGFLVSIVVKEVVYEETIVETGEEAFYQRTTLRAFAECTNLSNI